MKMTVLRTYSCQKDVAGKHYKLTIKEGLKKTERFYELTEKGKSLDKFMPEDQETFRNMESDLAGADAGFAGLEEELNKL